MIRRSSWLTLFAVACLSASAGAPLLAQGQKAPAADSAIRPLTTDQIAAWLCKALPTKDGAKISKILFDGKVPGEVDGKNWEGFVTRDDKRLIDLDFMSMGREDVGAWLLSIDLAGDWHGISEQDWVALARRIPGRVEEDDLQGINICAPEKKESCKERANYEAGPGVRRLRVVWGTSDPDPSTSFCSRG